MKTFSLWLFIWVFTLPLARAQDAAAQQQIDKLSGQIQELQEAQAQQDKRLDALEKTISTLSDKLNAPAANTSASADDLKALAAQVQEINKKRQDDRDLILKEIEKLGKVGGGSSGHKIATTTSSGDTSAAPAGPQKGYYYPVKAGDTLSGIAKAYRESDQHVKVTTSQILAANPGLDATKLFVGQKIFIPDANAK